MSKSVLGFYLWGHTNVESADYVLGRMRTSYPDSDLVISSDNGNDFSEVAEKHKAVNYIHGNLSHGYPQSPDRYGWTAAQAVLWLTRIYEACKVITNDFVMLMEEDILIKERFKFPAKDIIMIPNIKNGISPEGMDWVKSRGGRTDYPYYSAGGGTIIKRQSFIDAFDKHLDDLVEKYEDIYQASMARGYQGWGWNDSILAVLMYANNSSFSTELPIIESGVESDPAPIIHNFKKYYAKNLNKKSLDKVLYYHAYLDGNYKLIIQDQLLKIFTSGLYNELSRLELRCASPFEEDYVWLEDLVKNYSKINIQRIEINKEDYPNNYRESKITLQQLSEDAKQNNAIFGYIHTKGVFNTGTVMDDWRLSMDYATIVNWKNCLKELETVDAVGPNLRHATHVGYFPHFSGTYWWTTSNHIKTLDSEYLRDLKLLGTNNHLLEEFWIGSNHNAALKSIFECGHNEPYLTETTINKYLKEEDYIKLFHFYHIYADGDWKDIVNEHIEVIKKYGLYDRLSFFGIGIVGNSTNIQKVKNFLSNVNINYTLVFESNGDTTNQWEQETLDKLLDYCKENSGYVLYAHTKGAAYNYQVSKNWRKEMTLHNIANWKDSISHLKSYDAVGCYWCTTEKNGEQVTSPFFGGNFWWANTSFIKTLSYPKRDNRFDAEGWLGYKTNINTYELAAGWPSPELFANEITL